MWRSPQQRDRAIPNPKETQGSMMMKLTFVSILIASVASRVSSEACCLCGDCGPLEIAREGAFVFNDRTNKLSTCESLAWELIDENIDHTDPVCLENQSMFRETCCTDNTLTEPVRDIGTKETDGRKLWGTSSWGKPTTNYASFNNAVRAPTNWGNNNSNNNRGFSTSFGGSSCSLCSGMGNPSLGIVVNGPGFQYTGPCRGLNSALSRNNIKTTHQMCGVTIARFRHECQCGGAQNNAASFFGTAPNKSGLNSWCIKGFTC